MDQSVSSPQTWSVQGVHWTGGQCFRVTPVELPVFRDVLLFFLVLYSSSMIAMKKIERNLRALPLK